MLVYTPFCGLLRWKVSILCRIFLLDIVNEGWKFFLLKIIPRNSKWLMTGIYVQSSVNVELLFIFLKWQKCMHHVLLLLILKQLVYFLDALLQLMLCYAHVFRSRDYTDVINIWKVINSRIQAFGNVVDF